MSRKTHTFDSRAQQRWAFATHQPWAKRWGENTELAGKEKRLPPRKRAPKSVYRTARSLMGKVR